MAEILDFSLEVSKFELQSIIEFTLPPCIVYLTLLSILAHYLVLVVVGGDVLAVVWTCLLGYIIFGIIFHLEKLWTFLFPQLWVNISVLFFYKDGFGIK